MKMITLIILLAIPVELLSAWIPPTSPTGIIQTVTADSHGVVVTPLNFNAANGIATTGEVAAVSNAIVSANARKVDLDGGNFVAYPPTIEVFGEPAGIYTYAGMYNARPSYTLDGVGFIYWNSASVWWDLYENAYFQAISHNTTDSYLPPKGDWGNSRSVSYETPAEIFLSAVGAASSGTVATVYAKVDGLEAGTEDFEALNVNGETIAAFSDIGLTYTNAVRINNPIIITNDASWTGWTTTGTLGTNGVILLDQGQYIRSPVQTNGIAMWTIAENGTGRNIWGASIVTNGIKAQDDAPWYGPTAQLMITNSMPLPMMNTAFSVTNVVLVGYADAADAARIQYVANLCRVDQETRPCDLTRKVYVDDGDAADKAYADAQIAGYAADSDKTLRGAVLRLGNMWVVSPADASGERWICSGGEISGDGELVGTTNEFVISKNDYPLVSFTSSASGLFVTNFAVSATSSNATFSLYVATNGVGAAPYAEWTDSLVVGEWNRVLTYAEATYPVVSNGTYKLTFTIPSAGPAFVRVMQPIGDSVATVNTDVFNIGTSRLTFVDIVVSSNVYRFAVSNGMPVLIKE